MVVAVGGSGVDAEWWPVAGCKEVAVVDGAVGGGHVVVVVGEAISGNGGASGSGPGGGGTGGGGRRWWVGKMWYEFVTRQNSHRWPGVK